MKQRTLVTAIVIFTICIIYCLLSWRSLVAYESYFGTYHDDAIYLMTACALAEGKGYRIVSLPGEPPQTKYPMGFPLTLASIWRVDPHFPSNVVVFAMVQIVLTFVAIAALVIFLLRFRFVTRWLALTIFCAAVFNYRFLNFAPVLMSDFPGLLLTIPALWLTHKWKREAFSYKRAITIGVLMALPVTIRYQALIVPLSCSLYLLLNKRIRFVFIAGSTALLCLIPQIFWQFQAQRFIDPYYLYYSQYLAHAYGSATVSIPSLMEIWNYLGPNRRVLINTCFPFLEQIHYEQLSPLVFELIYGIGYLVFSLPFLFGAIRELRQRSVMSCYWLLSWVLLIVWTPKFDWRFIVPLLVLNYYVYFRGARLIAFLIKPKNSTWRLTYKYFCNVVAIIFCVYLVAGILFESFQLAGRYGEFIAKVDHSLSPQTQNKDYKEACNWIKSNTRLSDVFVCNNDPLLYLYTYRHAVFPSKMERWRFIDDKLVDPQSLLEAMKFSHARYVMCDPMNRSIINGTRQSASAINTIAHHYPGLLKLVFKSSNKLIYIFIVDQSKLGTVEHKG